MFALLRIVLMVVGLCCCGALFVLVLLWLFLARVCYCVLCWCVGFIMMCMLCLCDIILFMCMWLCMFLFSFGTSVPLSVYVHVSVPVSFQCRVCCVSVVLFSSVCWFVVLCRVC